MQNTYCLMDSAVIQFRLFLLLDYKQEASHIIDQAKVLSDTDLYIFDDMLSMLAHIHLNPDLLLVDAEKFDLVFLLKQIKEESPSTKTILIGNALTIQKIISLLKLGASDYFQRTDLPKDLLSREKTSFYQKILSDKTIDTKISLVEKYKTFGFIGNSRVMRKLYRLIESGTGKELVANTIHQLSKNKEKPFFLFDIYSTPKELLETTLFGQEKNVFSGILKRQIGIIEQASGSTLIIDNINALSLVLQTRLHRALQEKKFLRPGGQNIVFLNARIIALSQIDLLKAVNKNLFRKDLYYSLSNILIEIPPLRKRGQDILLHASHILREFIRNNKLKSLIFTQIAKDALLNHPFPGNIRELKSIIESSAMMATPPEIDKEDLIFNETPSISDWLGEELSMQEFTTKIILYYLSKYDNDVLLVAQKLAIGKSTIYRLLKKVST